MLLCSVPLWLWLCACLHCVTLCCSPLDPYSRVIGRACEPASVVALADSSPSAPSLAAAMSRPASASVSTPQPARIRKLSTAAVTKPLPDAPLTAEQLQVQIVPKDAAMLELIPRGDVFASHKLAPHATRGDALPTHIGEKLALFEQSFSVLRFPHKNYQPVVLDPPSFNQTFNVDTVVVPQAGQAAANSSSSSGSGATGAPGEAAAPPLSALLRTTKSKDLTAADDSVEARPTKLKQATVADVFESLSLAEGARARGADSTAPPVPAGYEGKAPEQGEKAAPIPEGGAGASSAAPASSASSPSDDMRVTAGPAAVTNPYTAESCVTVSDGALPLRSYFPQWDWGQGAESALCERVPLPLPSSRANHSGGANATRFLLHAKALQLAAGGREIEPLFCELALYNVSPDARCKVSDTFYVQLNKAELIKMIEDSRTANLPKNLALQVPGADALAPVASAPAAVAAPVAAAAAPAASAAPAVAAPAAAASPSLPTPPSSPIPISDAAPAPATAAAAAAPAAAAAAAAASSAPAGLNPDSTPISPFMPDSYINSTSNSPCTRAIFSVPAGARTNVVLVLLVYKVLQGKIDSVLDLYATSGEKIKGQLREGQNWTANRKHVCCLCVWVSSIAIVLCPR